MDLGLGPHSMPKWEPPTRGPERPSQALRLAVLTKDEPTPELSPIPSPDPDPVPPPLSRFQTAARSVCFPNSTVILGPTFHVFMTSSTEILEIHLGHMKESPKLFLHFHAHLWFWLTWPLEELDPDITLRLSKQSERASRVENPVPTERDPQTQG